MGMIAGHTFTDTSTGRRCMTHNNQGQLCYRSWLSIRDTLRTQIGKPRIAHNGDLNDSEYGEIERERDRETEVAWEAVVYAASAGSR